jgi:acetyltransferase-like isoleucine patch superfamily enzyme
VSSVDFASNKKRLQVGARTRFAEARNAFVRKGWERVQQWGAVGHHSEHATRYGSFGEGSYIAFPWNTIYGERWMRIGADTYVGPGATLSVGIHPDQVPISDPVLVIGDRCLINKGTAIVAHFSIVIEDDVWTGHNCYVTDQNHGYEDITKPIGVQAMPEQPVRIGRGSWLGFGVTVLPGVTIGEHVVIGAGSVVTNDLPANCVAGGVPAQVIRFHDGEQWVRAERTKSR